MTSPTINTDIYVGFKNSSNRKSISYRKARKFIHTKVEQAERGSPIGCVALSKVDYLYKGGKEKGILIHLINYPRFPNTRKDIRAEAIKLATATAKEFKQCRVTVVMKQESIMVSSPRQINFIEKGVMK